MMGQALYHLHWTADQFWSSTPHEFYSACEAGDSTPAATTDDPFTPTADFIALRDAHLAKEKRSA